MADRSKISFRKHGMLTARAPKPSDQIGSLELTVTPAAWSPKRQKSDMFHLPPVSPRPLVQSQESVLHEVFQREKFTVHSPEQYRPFMEVRGLGGQKNRVPQPQTIPPGWRDSGASVGRGYYRKDRARTRSYESKGNQQEVRTPMFLFR